MNAHITHEEMTELLMGARTSTLESHLQACSGCREEFARMKGSLESFRVASHAWSDRAAEAGGTQQVMAFPRKSFYAWWRLAAVAAVLALVFAAAYRMQRAPSTDDHVQVKPAPSTVSTQDQISQDNELLAQVESEISENVPTPMQPLQISTANSESSSQNNK